jgi:hypothetical protein
VVPTLESSGNWKWWSFVLLIALALSLPELMLGPFGLIAGVLATIFGIERAIHAWRRDRRYLSLCVTALDVAVLVYLLTPNWCHAGNAYREGGRWIGVTHCHRAWDFDHIH